MDLSSFLVLAGLAPYVLIFGGVGAVSKLLSSITKGSTSYALKGLGYLGIFVGALLLTTGVVIFLGEAWSWDVWVLLVATGLGLVLKPLSRIPFSALLGIVTGLVCAGLLYVYIPLPVTVLGVSSLWIYLAVFLIPALIVFLIFKFVEDLAKLFGVILGSRPVLTALGFLCIAQGILMLFNRSLLSLFA